MYICIFGISSYITKFSAINMSVRIYLQLRFSLSLIPHSHSALLPSLPSPSPSDHTDESKA